MPLHDWTNEKGWDGVHLLWISQLLDTVQAVLPEGYRAYVGAVPALTIDAPNGRPDLRVHRWSPTPPESEPGVPASEEGEPETEAVATFTLDPQLAIHIDRDGQLIAAVELVSPRNKDRHSSQIRYRNRYLGYLRQGVHLLLIDVLPRPRSFSFAEVLARDLGFEQPPCPPPFAISYRVGEPVPEGTILGTWCRPLRVGEPLPHIPLALTMTQKIAVDLESSYVRAATRAYLE